MSGFDKTCFGGQCKMQLSSSGKRNAQKRKKKNSGKHEYF